jgi:hypothetical protein
MTSLRTSKPLSSARCPRSEIKVGNGIVVTCAAVPLKGGDGLGSPGNVITFPRFGAPNLFDSQLARQPVAKLAAEARW